MRLALAFLALALVVSVARADPAYDRFRQPEKVMAALALKPGQRVADLGAGSGYFTFRIADAVGAKGRVVATDIDDAALDAIRARVAGRANVVVRKVAPDDPGLEAGAFDVVFLSFLDQYVPDRAAYLGRLAPALAPGGKIAVLNRLPFRAPLLAAAARAGYAVAAELPDKDAPPGQFLVWLQRK